MPGLNELETCNTSRLGLRAGDYRGVRFEMLCEPGDSVQAGAAVMRDARRPEICISAPSGGRIGKIERGARRRLLNLQIEADDDLGAVDVEPPAGQDRNNQRAFMLRHGSWSHLRTRPFGNIPDPDADPAAILVTAIDEAPQAPPVAMIIDAFADEFSAAVEMLARISDAPLYVCQAPGYRVPLDPASRAVCRSFAGGFAAGLPGRHIQALCPIGFRGGEAWHIGYQQVIALGHLLVHGKPWLQRVISIGGDAVLRPRCLRVPPGAALAQLLEGELDEGPLRMLDGSTIFGREIEPAQAFLGLHQRQLTVNRVTGPGSATATGEALLPGDWLESLAPPGIHPVPLLRALQIGDAERAQQLGALELVEEDLAPLSRACVSNSDYGLLLRRVLDQLEALR